MHVALIVVAVIAGLLALCELMLARAALQRIARTQELANRTPAWRAIALDAVEFCDRPAPQSVERREALRELKARVVVEEAHR